MELELKNGDYIADGVGGLRRVGGREALLQRVLFRLTARRGSFPFQEDLGSRLWALGRLPVQERRSAARQYVTEALAGEPVTVEEVTLDQGRDVFALPGLMGDPHCEGSNLLIRDGAAAGAVHCRAAVMVKLHYKGEDLPVTVEVFP